MKAILDSRTVLRNCGVALIAIAAQLAQGSSAAAIAQEIYPVEVEDQCRSDYFKHCSPYALGSAELRRCMEVQGKQLSPNCRQALKDAGLVRSSSTERR